jgi:hypothetical protein
MKSIFNTLIILLLINFSLSAQFLGGNGSGYGSVTYSEGPLPVELTSFTASVVEEGVSLQWVTQTEIKNFGFEVERLSDSKDANWLTVGFVQGNGTSQNINKYNFLDDNNLAGSYHYRLKQIDNNGEYNYSTSIMAAVEVPKNITLDQNFPNPFNPSTSIKFTLIEQAFVNLSVYNVIGEQVAILVNGTREAGAHKVNFNASHLISGIYFYKLEVNDFIKTNKMQLIK